MARVRGGLIEAVEPRSLAQRAGLRVGDGLLAINDQEPRDIIDVQYYAADDVLELLISRDGQPQRVQIERIYGEELGLSFVNPTFDVDIRRCANNCDFCFVKQNAPGMRRSLYVKDDDYRYSFLFGNFVTLTNLTDEDWARLEEQRLSPLYVSVHATDPGLRRRLLACGSAPDVIAQLRRLAELGIDVHTQVVLIPGLNDGEQFAQTIAELTALYQVPVASVGVVPVGLTKYHRGKCRVYTPEEAQAILAQVAPWRSENRQKTGVALVYPSDEWYLLAGQEVPSAEDYDGFPQAANGVGMVRQLLEEWDELKMNLAARNLRPMTLVCGTLILPVLARIVEELNARMGADLRLAPVVNQFFGPVTTVSGLLTGADVVATLRSQLRDDLLLLPRAMFTERYGVGSAPPGTTLDGMTIADLSTQLGVPVEMVRTMGEVLALGST